LTDINQVRDGMGVRDLNLWFNVKPFPARRFNIKPSFV